MLITPMIWCACLSKAAYAVDIVLFGVLKIII